MEELNSLKQVVGNLSELARGLTLKQKLTLGAGVLLVGATLFGFVTFVNKPELNS